MKSRVVPVLVVKATASTKITTKSKTVDKDLNTARINV